MTKTLIILTPGFPANEADSTCLPFPQLFVKTLQQLNPSLHIIVLAFQYPFFTAEYEWNGVKVIAYNGQNKGKIKRLMVWKAAWKKINAIVKENNVTGILNFWLGECGLIGKYAAKRHTLKSYTWLLGQDARKGNLYFSFIKPDAQSLVALSDFLAEEFYRNYGIKPAHIIPPGIDTNEFSAGTSVRDIDILGVGSLIPLKRYDIFINVIAGLVKINPHIKAAICGQGPEKVPLQKMIDDAGLSKNIVLFGEVSHHEVLVFMQRSGILLHPSSYEGFSTVLSEALYAGAHVVCFCNPMNTIFKQQHVVKTETEMINTVEKLLNDSGLCHEKIITYPIETVCRKILLLYGA
jgi:glycosyltransferase involved in cell wall biosynthesis